MECRICSSKNLDLVVNLGKQPWCNNFLTKSQLGKEKFYPLKLMYCNNCSLAQLSYTVKKEIMFSDHTYLSGITNTLSNHFKKICTSINKQFNYDKSKKSILDLGSNDGTFLKHFKNIGWEILGIESSKRISIIANKNGIKTINKFFNYELALSIKKKFDFVNASGVFFHLEELHSFTKGVKYLLANEGVFIVQFLYMKSIVNNLAFDQIYHEHLLYYNLSTLQKLLDMYDLEIFDCYLTSVHGGQMITYISHRGTKTKTKRLFSYLKKEKNSKCNSKSYYLDFAKNIIKLKDKNIKFLKDCRRNEQIVFGMGAPVKGNTLLNYFNINKNLIQKLLEKNQLRKNLYAPGSHIPIVMENEEKIKPDVYYVLAWNFKKEILNNNKQLIKRGVKFFFPINPKKN
jgi:2-polyprenyl-3-methyl-5-hydroxy-6-metoxy-1,4-benzoquinol methylase